MCRGSVGESHDGYPYATSPGARDPSEAVSAEGAEPTAYANALSAEFVLGGRS